MTQPLGGRVMGSVHRSLHTPGEVEVWIGTEAEVLLLTGSSKLGTVVEEAGTLWGDGRGSRRTTPLSRHTHRWLTRPPSHLTTKRRPWEEYMFDEELFRDHQYWASTEGRAHMEVDKKEGILPPMLAEWCHGCGEARLVDMEPEEAVEGQVKEVMVEEEEEEEEGKV